MSKLSFVALSLQTTHLDPASVSRVTYVKLVDGNITRQDDIPIIPPTGKLKATDEQAERSHITWNATLEKLGMMIGKLPIVSYYRDADKEIFHAASRQLNIEPPVLHWLDCRELARKLLPELPDVQLSTVLKTLDLYDDYADSSAVEQTTQIVIALAQRQDAQTVAQLWDELYNQPENLLGLDSTFEGAADSGSSTDDDDVIDAPSAAEVLPFAPAVGAAGQTEQAEQAAEPIFADAAPAEATQDESGDAPASPGHAPSLDEATEVASSTQTDTQLPAAHAETAVDQVLPPAPGSDELPLFLQEPTRDERDDLHTEATEPDAQPDTAAELAGATATSSSQSVGSDDESVESLDAALDEETRVDEAVEESHTEHSQPLAPPALNKKSVEPADDVPVERVDEDAVDPHEPETSRAFLEETAPEVIAQQDIESAAPEQAEPADLVAADEVFSDSPQEEPHPAEAKEAPVLATTARPPVVTPIGDRASQPTDSMAQPQTAHAVKVSDRPRVSRTSRPASNVNQIFGFVGLFVFGLLSIIGIVLVVMASMLFFTENSLMLETKIAGMILTLAITLLSLLMTSVSYRSFRQK
ncbi:hypothetical protein [Enteractinococcus coprophilus]|uniref:Uncharacterized protein n=1 Tax=Enteractinococcus coprophilus TaxID=1027633 RepID=A0A543AMA3_9MICC|nr:hypothetical protein [Enteractinococcus coprophilus]TQL73717.1 hypothetical protein FB556_0160 [Enteractinococcus coprophilus]